MWRVDPGAEEHPARHGGPVQRAPGPSLEALEPPRNGNADTQRPYDLLSIMHYGQTSFTKNGLPTIVLTARGQAALGARSLSSVGQREGLSQRDFEQLVDLYNCCSVRSACVAEAGFEVRRMPRACIPAAIRCKAPTSCPFCWACGLAEPRKAL